MLFDVLMLWTKVSTLYLVYTIHVYVLVLIHVCVYVLHIQQYTTSSIDCMHTNTVYICLQGCCYRMYALLRTKVSTL